MGKNLLIGQLAEQLGITPQAIRYYERLGLLEKPPRNEAGYRIYSSTANKRLQLIRNAQTFGLSLTQIKELINSEKKEENLALLFQQMVGEYLTELEEKIAYLETQKKELNKRNELLNKALNTDQKITIITTDDLIKLLDQIETESLLDNPLNSLKKGEQLVELYMAGERDFRGIELMGAKLNGAMLNDINLSQSQLMLASLNEVCLGKANLKESYFNGADLIGAYLEEANLLEAFFIGADLTEANLKNANLVNCNLGGACLQGANLQFANLTEAIFIGADLRNADLRGAIILGCNFFEANLTNAIFDDHVTIIRE
jgi:uncharacterized protein YjbI with pentapeptide repeats